MCVATDIDLSAQLPSNLDVPSFTPLQGIVGLKDVIKGYEQALGAKAFTQSTLEWDVASRRPMQGSKSKLP